MTDVFIDGIGIAGYRSFGENIQYIGPCRKINLIIGQNNSGKSNILSYIKYYYAEAIKAAKSSAQLAFQPLDQHVVSGGQSQTEGFAYALPVGGEEYRNVLERMLQKVDGGSVSTVRAWLEKLLRSEALTKGTDTIWFTFKSNPNNRALMLDTAVTEAVEKERLLNEEEWRDLRERSLSHRSGDSLVHYVRDVMRAIASPHFTAPGVELIPAIRRVGDAGSSPNDYSGVGLIDRLAQLQNPGYAEQEKRQHFNDINSFLQKVVGNTTATLEIPYKRDAIIVHMSDRPPLPLSSLGTGIHEVVILAAAATVLRKQVLCIEELELHLHPLLQRKLIRYLADKTDNQYFITTHSAHLLDTPEAAISHVRHHEGASIVDPVYNSREKAAVCIDLGYRPSDLMQANCVIWVEGPSDRIYLNHWIRTVAPKLIEGIHYSVMFYGGRLLSHLSADDPEVTDFISLRRLNRYISILIDSDRSNSAADINSTKKRIVEEFNQGPGFAWVTAGREIENYIPNPGA